MRVDPGPSVCPLPYKDLVSSFGLQMVNQRVECCVFVSTNWFHIIERLKTRVCPDVEAAESRKAIDFAVS